MSSRLPTWAIVVPQSSENKEELLRQFVQLLRGRCSVEGLELPHPFVYLWADLTEETLPGLGGFLDNLLSATFDFVLCVYNTGSDGGPLPRVRGNQHSALYLPFTEIENVAAVGEVLLTMSACFARRQGSASESAASSSPLLEPERWQTITRSPLRTLMGRTTNSRDDFLFIAKDGVSIVTTKQAASNSYRLSNILEKGKASASLKSIDAPLLMLAVQWLEYSNRSFYGCYGRLKEGDVTTGAQNACICCKPNVHQARLLDYNQRWWWDLLAASGAPLKEMHGAIAARIANAAPPAQLKDLYSDDRSSRSSTASWPKVAFSLGSIPMPSELPDQVLLKVICSYSSRYPSLQWTEEFASISPQWKHVIDTNRDQLPRLLVHTVKVRGSQLEILLQPNDPQPTTGGRREPVILNDQAANTASMLCRIAARSLIISLEQNETLEDVLVYVGHEGLRATSVSLEPLGRLVDATCLTHIMRAIGETHTLKAKITCTRDIEALLPAFPRHILTFEMDLGSCRALDDDSALNLFLYFANRVMSERFYFDFVIERYHSDALELANRIAKKFSCGIASRLNVLVLPTNNAKQRNYQTTIALNIRRSDGRRLLAVHEGHGMRIVIGDDEAVNECESLRKYSNALLQMLNRGSSEFEHLQKAVYETLFSRVAGYVDLQQLLHDLRQDYGIDGEEEAQRFAYELFTDFLCSAEMKAKVNVTQDISERTVYEAIPTVDNMHLRWEQQKSAVSAAEKSAKKASNEATDARRKLAELERRLRDVPELERRVQELELQVRQRDETIRQRDDKTIRERDEAIHQLSGALLEAESKIECFCCKDRPIEVVFHCGHGACRVCTEQLTTEERPAPGTSQFSANRPNIRARKADPKCSQCKKSVDPCIDFYGFRS